VRERDLEHAAHDLDRLRRRALQAAALAAAAGVVALLAGLLFAPLALAMAVGAVAEIVLAVGALYGRRQLVARLALQPAAYVIPEVAAYGTRAAELCQRARLAEWIVEVLAEAGSPHSLYLGERVRVVAHELEALAHDLVSPVKSVEPVSAVACRRLLTRMTESPLYNPRLPLEDLQLALHGIRAGIA
jgi:hypothetical protein